MNKENPSFPGLCRAFRFKQSFRGERASLSTSDPVEKQILGGLIDDRDLPLGVIGTGFNQSSEGGTITLESRDIAGIRQLARRLQRRDFEVEDLDRANSSS